MLKLKLTQHICYSLLNIDWIRVTYIASSIICDCQLLVKQILFADTIANTKLIAIIYIYRSI